MGAGYIVLWLQSKIKSAYVKLEVPIDTLFIDAKQLYYRCIRKGKPEICAIKPFTQNLRNIMYKYVAKNFIFISIDGPNPAAKFQTQRTRKYKREHKQDFCYPKEPFDMLSTKQPADEVDKALKFLLNKLNIKTGRIYYSSGYAPGEAEHKYLKFFRDSKNSPDWIPNQNHFIFTDDNDLVLLSLLFMDENIYIIKTRGDIVSISIVRDYLLKRVHDSLNQTKKEIDNTRVIHDIVAISFLLGNDFIPEFPDIRTTERKFDLFIDAYIAINQNEDPNYQYLIENDSFNVLSLQKLVSLFFHKDIPIPNTNDPKYPENKQVAQDVLRILNFTWLYYTRGTPSWTYYYPHEYSPYLFSAVSLMDQEGPEFFDNLPSDEVTDPFLKALVNHPPDSQSNIPWGIYKIKIPPSPIAEKYWPLRKSNLPIFDLEEIKTFYRKEVIQLSPDELALNRREPLFVVYEKGQNKERKNSNQNHQQNQNSKDDDDDQDQNQNE